MEPGIYSNISNDDYHAGEGVSKSGLWTLYKKTPLHYKLQKVKTTTAMEIGTATHTAVLEPENFEHEILKGPEDRRGNKWKDAQAEAAQEGKILLVAKDYEKVQHIRDSVHKSPTISAFVVGGTEGDKMVENSAYWKDPETGVLCRVRPDLVRNSYNIMLDLKTASDANPDLFARDVVKYGYHMQNAMYLEGWNQAGGQKIDQFMFLVVENEYPFATAIYTLDEEAVQAGRKAFRKSLNQYATCSKSRKWAGYGDLPKCLSLPKWALEDDAA